IPGSRRPFAAILIGGGGPRAMCDFYQIPTFVMMWLLVLAAWIGSHSGTDLAGSTRAAFTESPCALAEQHCPGSSAQRRLRRCLRHWPAGRLLSRAAARASAKASRG